MFQEYLTKVFAKYRSGDAGERTYYPVLEDLLKKFSETTSVKAQVIIEAKRTSVGVPDFKVKTDKDLLIGYVEAKDLGVDLDKVDQQQFEKYLKEYPKLIYTNFIEFRLYEDGKLVDTVQISQPVTLKLKTPVLDNEAKVTGLLEKFFSAVIPEVYTSKRLAELLAHKTRVIKELLVEEINLKDEEVTPTEELFEAFRKTLIPNLDPDQFADMYAQTITFGLFVGRLNSGDGLFNRVTATEYVPKTIPLLRKIFHLISGEDLPSHIKWHVEEMADILANAKIEKIKAEFFAEGKGRDPIIHFYETFLKEYDPAEREKRGVYYTPEPVVSYITRSINSLLKEKFGKSEGFADPSVIVLDPAAGTLTFPAKAIATAKDEYTKKYGEGGWPNLVEEHILKNFYAFELLMAPYAVGHLKIGLLLEDLGYKLKEDDRFKLYLTNTLEMEKVGSMELLLAKEISEESEKAYDVKTKTPILVIFGNPPYSVSSSNVIKEGTELHKLYESYKEQVRKEERNIQPLSDDYIKFLAFAHWKIKQAGKGIVGMITNNSYLDGLIHRDMRGKLLKDFDEIHVLNLHGSAKRQEVSPDGSKDENVFDIQQGVSIILLVKNEGLKKLVKYADSWGSRETKYDFLDREDVFTTDWDDLNPLSPNHYLVVKDFANTKQYEGFTPLKKIFNQFNAGAATGKDDVLVDFKKEDLVRRLSLIERSPSDISSKAYKMSSSLTEGLIEELKKMDIESRIYPYSYRPFDKRWVIYDKKILQRSRNTIMDNFLNQNLGLVTTKQLSTNEFHHAIATEAVSDRCLISLQTREVSYVFPLYLHHDQSQQSLLNNGHKSSNLQWGNLPYSTLQPFTSSITKTFIQPVEAIFYYIYAILYSDIYRKKYQEFLKIDFPRIPLTKDFDLLMKLAELGEELVNLHLLKSSKLDEPIVKFYGEGGDGKVETVAFNDVQMATYFPHAKEKPEFKSKGLVKINEKQFFGPVSKEVWEYQTGGYQVLNKWLKDRRGRTLSSDEIKIYCKIVSALSKTIEIQKEIDKLYPEVEKNLIETKLVGN